MKYFDATYIRAVIDGTVGTRALSKRIRFVREYKKRHKICLKHVLKSNYIPALFKFDGVLYWDGRSAYRSNDATETAYTFLSYGLQTELERLLTLGWYGIDGQQVLVSTHIWYTLDDSFKTYEGPFGGRTMAEISGVERFKLIAKPFEVRHDWNKVLGLDITKYSSPEIYGIRTPAQWRQRSVK